MSLNDILPIIWIIIFWAILFVCVFAFWRSHAALQTPGEGESEAERKANDRAHATPAH
jgi:phosphotransferase system  glucose/maltose/N-acetylglucosamine-specific IIC component